MNIISSNSLEQLAENLCHKVATSGKDLFAKDIIIVQSQGMAKWLNMQLAQQNGISAQVEFPFIKGFIVNTLKDLGLLTKSKAWDRETMTWRIFRLLDTETIKNDTAFAEVIHYMRSEENRRHQLAQQLASLFDEYMVYRPHWLESWEQDKDFRDPNTGKSLGGHEAWQKVLWKSLVEEVNATTESTDDEKSSDSFHKALAQFNEQQDIDLKVLDLPSEISIFGISNLAPQFIQFFNKFSSNGIKIHFYYLSPCQEYWGDLKSKKRDLFERDENGEAKDLPHSLLKSWGLLGRDFLNLLIEGTEFDNNDLYLEREGENISSLGKIQNGILNLEENFKNPEGENDENLLKNDHSIVINSCHNPHREIEVLHDHIRDLISHNPKIKPRDIMVLCPDIAQYVPYIKSVFDNKDFCPPEEFDGDSKKTFKVPYSLTDRSLCDSSQIVNTFLKVLALPKGRLSNNDIINILENTDVLRKFYLTTDDLTQMRDWIEDAAIRWGESAKHRETLGLPGFNENSWAYGFERLVGGYAFEENVIYDDSLCTDIKGDAIALGRFKTAAEVLFELHDQLKKPQTPMQWIELLKSILSKVFSESYDTAAERGIIHLAIHQLEEAFKASDLPEEEIQPQIVIKELQTALANESSSHGFMDSGVTFCQLLPMRSIPAKVICILGMNEGEFPRQDRRSGFDLMEKSWAQGDRSARLDDRYLFLEALLAAQEHFYVSYKGRNEKDNTEIPPSIVLEELMEFLNAASEKDTNGKPLFGQKTEHPLQPFCQSYYDGTLKRSYSQKNYDAANALYKREMTEPQKFCPEPLPLPNSIKRNDDNSLEIELDNVVEFFKDPAKAFIKNQFNATLWQNELKEMQDSEAFDDATGLDRWAFRSHILEEIFALAQELQKVPEDNSLNELRSVLQDHYIKGGKLPYGEKGKDNFQEMYDTMKSMASMLWEKQGKVDADEACIIRQEFECDGEKVILKGKVDRLFGKLYLPYRVGSLGAKYKMEANLHYLALLVQKPKIPMAMEYIHLTEKKVKDHHIGKSQPANSLNPNIAKEYLQELLTLYLRGLQEPLPFFPKTFEKYISKIGKTKNETLQKQIDIIKKELSSIPSTKNDIEQQKITISAQNKPNANSVSKLNRLEKELEDLIQKEPENKVNLAKLEYENLRWFEEIGNQLERKSMITTAKTAWLPSENSSTAASESESEYNMICFGNDLPEESYDIFDKITPIHNSLWQEQEKK